MKTVLSGYKYVRACFPPSKSGQYRTFAEHHMLSAMQAFMLRSQPHVPCQPGTTCGYQHHRRGREGPIIHQSLPLSVAWIDPPGGMQNTNKYFLSLSANGATFKTNAKPKDHIKSLKGFWKLQLVQNVPAWAVSVSLEWRIAPILHDLHWPSVCFQVKIKVMVMKPFMVWYQVTWGNPSVQLHLCPIRYSRRCMPWILSVEELHLAGPRIWALVALGSALMNISCPEVKLAPSLIAFRSPLKHGCAKRPGVSGDGELVRWLYCP